MADAGPAHGWPWGRDRSPRWSARGCTSGLIITQTGLPSGRHARGLFLGVASSRRCSATAARSRSTSIRYLRHREQQPVERRELGGDAGDRRPFSLSAAARRRCAGGSPRRRPRYAAQDRRGARERRRLSPPHGEPRIIGPTASRGWCPRLGCSGSGASSGRMQVSGYIYAIGGNARPPAGRHQRSAIRTLASRRRASPPGSRGSSRPTAASISTTIDGGTLVLYAAAAAVIGTT